MSVSSLTSEDNQLNTLLAASTSYSLESTSNNKRICTGEPNTSNDNSTSNSINEDMYIDALGVCALVGYEAEVNHTIGLCKKARQDFNLLIISAKINIESYLTKHKHRIMYSCMTGNVDWFRILYKYSKKQDIIGIRTSDNKSLYHLLTMNPYDNDVEQNDVQELEGDEGTFIEWDSDNDEINHNTPLANMSGRLAIMNILSTKLLSISVKDINGNTCLGTAIKFQEIEMINALLPYVNKDNLNDVNERNKSLLLNNSNERWKSLLHIAISVGNIDIINRLCTLGINMGMEDWKERTPILYAVMKDNVKVVEALLQYQDKFDLDDVDIERNSIIHHAVMNDNLDMVHKLCTIPTMGIDLRNINGDTPLLCAAREGKASIVRELLQYPGRIDINSQGNDGNTALHLAVRGKHIEVVRLLLEAGINIPTMNNENKNAVMLCAISDAVEIMEVFLEYHDKLGGFDINMVDGNNCSLVHYAVRYNSPKVLQLLANIPHINLAHQDINGNTPLLHAVMENKEPILRELLQYRDRVAINSQANDRYTALHVACEESRSDIVELLLAAGCDHDIRNTYGSLPFHIACAKGNTGIVRSLLPHKHKFDIYSQTNNGHTALYLAARYHHVEIVRLLLEAGINITDMNTRNGNAIMYCALSDAVELMELFLQYQDKFDINAVDESNLSVVHYAVHGDSVNILRLFASVPNINFNNNDIDGNTPLSLAVTQNKQPILRELLQHPDRVNINIEHHSYTALHIACVQNKSDIVELLLAADCDPNLRSNDGFMPLLSACNNGNADTVRVLLQHQDKVNINNLDVDGSTALHLAVRNNHIEVVQLLLAAGIDTTIQDMYGRTAAYYSDNGL